MNQIVTSLKCFLGMLLVSSALLAQPETPPPAETKPVETKSEPAPVETKTADVPAIKPVDGTIAIDKRVFGVLPNYRTADGTATFEPISSHRKLYIGLKDSFDYPIFFTSALYSAIYQLEDNHPQFGQGTVGYAKRYLTSSTDLIVGNFMAESIFPILLKQDPRYFAIGPTRGGVWKRTGYALSRVLICRSDKGTTQFNFSEVLGNSVAVAFSNVYYSDSRTAADNVTSLGMQVGTDALSNVLKEFWPDIKRKFFKKKVSASD